MNERREQLLAEIREVQTRTGEHPYGELAEVPDTADEAVADLLIDVDHAMVDRDVQELRNIEAALQRMDDGSYGLCAHCGCTIEQERMLAFPTATRCRPCQEVYEKTYAHGPTPTL
ncbi:MAG: TraR/DksA family transcriptional regulator [Betaproteobacteria bacterium]|nr:TraR/DksA family transcriptional regulator [Betaproteobacteria bacterium]